MGTIYHNAIIVTGWDLDDRIERAHAEAKRLGMRVSEIVWGTTNGYQTFMVAPDGSKEWWEESDRHDGLREQFRAYLDAMEPYPLDWVEVRYGECPAQAIYTTRGAEILPEPK